MIEFTDLAYCYNSKDAFTLHDITLQFKKAKILGVLGHNGAGKSTLIKLICGLLPITAKSFTNNGSPILCQRSEMLHTLKMGFSPDISELDPDLTAKDMFELVGALRGMSEQEIEIEISHFIEVFQMKEWFQNMLAKQYSLGMRKKVSLGIALLGPVEYAVLDEPFNGLDPIASFKFKKLLLQKKEHECGILISSNLLEIVENLIDHVLILNQGVSIFNDTLEVLKNKYPQCNNLEEIYYHLHSHQ